VNLAIAAVYAITVRHPSEADRPYTDAEKDKLIACLPALIDQVQRLEKIARDPFVKGYLERFGVQDNGNG
jgi:hypothetical protein